MHGGRRGETGGNGRSASLPEGGGEASAHPPRSGWQAGRRGREDGREADQALRRYLSDSS